MVPEDLAVVGFDDIPLSSYFDPPLTTVKIPMHDLGAASMTMLLNLISGEKFEKLKLFKATTSGPGVHRKAVEKRQKKKVLTKRFSEIMMMEKLYHRVLS